MNKERLEEIVEKISEQTFDRIIVPQTKITIEYQDIKFLINAVTKQAERVQELEKDIKEWKIVNECWEEINTNLAEQNKRYREAIERALGESRWGDEGNALYRTIGILTKALEGEE